MSAVGLTVGYYSVRRLSPFQGVLQITEAGDTRALSADGINWQIQIRHDMSRPRWGSLDHIVLTRRYLRYGIWTRGNGLSRLPIPPTVDVNTLRKKASTLIEAVKSIPSEPRFPLGDCIELWLLDACNGLPLALLASALSRDRRRALRTAEWVASSTRKSNIAATGPSETLPKELRAAVDKLVRTTSGIQGQAQWFERTPSGEGIGLDGVRLELTLRDRRLPASVFPELPLKTTGLSQTSRKPYGNFTPGRRPCCLLYRI